MTNGKTNIKKLKNPFKAEYKVDQKGKVTIVLKRNSENYAELYPQDMEHLKDICDTAKTTAESLSKAVTS